MRGRYPEGRLQLRHQLLQRGVFGAQRAALPRRLLRLALRLLKLPLRASEKKTRAARRRGAGVCRVCAAWSVASQRMSQKTAPASKQALARNQAGEHRGQGWPTAAAETLGASWLQAICTGYPHVRYHVSEVARPCTHLKSSTSTGLSAMRVVASLSISGTSAMPALPIAAAAAPAMCPGRGSSCLGPSCRALGLWGQGPPERLLVVTAGSVGWLVDWLVD